MTAFRKVLGMLVAFVGNRKANVAIIYALAILPLAVAAGAALDYARAVIVRYNLAEALDAAGLAIGGAQAMDQQSMTALAQSYFNANYKINNAYGTPAPVAVVQSGQDFSLQSSVTVPTVLLKLAGVYSLPVSYSVTITRNSMNLEVALALDITGSMSGQKLTDLQSAANDLINMVVQDQQSPTYSKVAIAPYTTAVNVGSYANQVRGGVTAPTAITNAVWANGSAKNITGATRANPVVITANNHGFNNGDVVAIKSVSGMTQLNYSATNNNYYVVASKTTNTFALHKANGQNVDGTGYNYYSGNGTVTKCLTAACEVIVTSNGHNLVNGDGVYISGVGGMTQINDQYNPPFSVSNVTANTFVLAASKGPSYSAYTSGGSAYCTNPGCQYLRFANAKDGSLKVLPISTCATERTTDAYTDAPPTSTLLGRDYHAASPYAYSVNPCPTPTIIPLSTDRTALTGVVNGLSAGGSTAGHIGTAWAWYLLSPNFAYLWPADSQPAAYGTANTMKFAIIMTDGDYNTQYCNGVISKETSTSGGMPQDHNNCTAPNGSSIAQAKQICAGMKAQGITVYTVGFQVGTLQTAIDVLNSCATDSDHAFFPQTGADLKGAFHAIAQQITNLRIKS